MKQCCQELLGYTFGVTLGNRCDAPWASMTDPKKVINSMSAKAGGKIGKSKNFLCEPRLKIASSLGEPYQLLPRVQKIVEMV